MKFQLFTLFITLLIVSVMSENHYFLHVSDIHFDPISDPLLYGNSTFCRSPTAKTPTIIDGGRFNVDQLFKQFHNSATGSFGRYGCDTSTSLLSALSLKITDLVHSIQQNSDSTVDFMLVNGDSCAHALNSSQVISAMRQVNDHISSALEAFRSLENRVIYTVGNNDVSPDYDVVCNDSIFNAFQTQALANRIVGDAQKASWQKFGSYLFDLSNDFLPNTYVLSVNTVFYSNKHQPSYEFEHDPCSQLSWIEQQLQYVQALDGGQVIFMAHIPFGLDSYADVPMLFEKFSNQLIQLLEKFDDVVVAVMFGHLHTDETRAFSTSSLGPIMFEPSISPIFGNNPSIRMVRYQPVPFRILDYTQYVFNLAESNRLSKSIWSQEYSFSSAYNFTEITRDTLFQLTSNLYNDYNQFYQWNRRLYSDSAQNEIAPNKSLAQKQYLCVQRELTHQEFSQCLKSPPF
mmetsp:Transcript_7821/g.11858  ORF Transcript_7821/g.11858 Transcript_7821/m.11858 type:complete len:459 (+) Transcript_7821:1819-3195(+)